MPSAHSSEAPSAETQDLRGFSPKEGDLVLLIEGNTEFPIPPLFAYVNGDSSSGIPIHVIDPQTLSLICTFYAQRAALFDVYTEFGKGNLPFPKEVTTELKYRTSRAVVGRDEIIVALRATPGLELYADVVERGFPSNS